MSDEQTLETIEPATAPGVSASGDEVPATAAEASGPAEASGIATPETAAADTATEVEIAPPPPTDGGDLSLLALIDRLADLLGRSDLTELEVEAGGTGLVLRKPSALAPPSVVGALAVGVGGAAAPDGPGSAAGSAGSSPASIAQAAPTAKPSVKAPLTGIFYTSPAPGTAPYVRVGGEVAVGQVIGLIEAMKLFNEIKSDLAGRVTRIAAESGALVKAKQALIEVEPL